MKQTRSLTLTNAAGTGSESRSLEAQFGKNLARKYLLMKTMAPYKVFLSIGLLGCAPLLLTSCKESAPKASAGKQVPPEPPSPPRESPPPAPALPRPTQPGVTLNVAPSGDDSAPGTAAQPLRTIQAAAQRAKPGDTVQVAPGTYRETVRPANSGTPENPITFLAESGVMIAGADPVTGWSGAPDGIQTAPLPANWFSRATPGDGTNLYDPSVHNQANQIFVDGRMMLLARWPNSANLDPSYPAKAVTERFISKTRDALTHWTFGIFEDNELALPPEAAVGAEIMFQPNWEAWSWLFTGQVTAIDGHRLTFRSRSDAGKDFKQGIYDERSRYFLFNKLGLLDAPGEWFHDKPAGLLHLKSPDSRPLEGRVTAKRREFGFDLTERSHIVVKGFAFHACTLTTDRESGGDNIGYTPEGKNRFPWRNAAHQFPEEPYFDPAFKDAPSTGVFVVDCSFEYPTHFTDVSGHFECQWGQSSGVVLSGRNHVIIGCRVRFSAGNGIVLLGREHRALGNLIEDVNYAATDCGAVHTGVTARASTDHEIAWNTVRRTGRSGIMIRKMARRDPADGSPWKGRIHHNDVSEFGIQDWDLGGICSTGYDGRYVRIDHNWVHDAFPTPDNVPGSRAFTAGGIYLDYSTRFLVDHNVCWNVEWGIHLQAQTHGSKTAGFYIVNNTVAVLTLGGGPSRHGPYGVVRNSAKASFQETLVADNLFLLLDGSKTYKPVDFETDATVNRRVENNLSSTSPGELGLAGGRDFPAALFPAPSPANAPMQAKAPPRKPAPVNGLTPPAWQHPGVGPTDLGAYEAGQLPWRAGHTAWPR